MTGGKASRRAPRAVPKSRKPAARKLVYQFHVELQHVSPAIWRRILVPANYNFWDLHVAIQDSMGWEDRHLHMFRGVSHRVRDRLQIGIPDEFDTQRCEPGWEIALQEFFCLPGDSADYEYDFGDGWEHEVLLEGLFLGEKGKRYPACSGGARACPPEDCGGPSGYEHFLEAIRDPAHEEHDEYVRWAGGSFDPEAFDAGRVKFHDPMKRWKQAFQRAR